MGAGKVDMVSNSGWPHKVFIAYHFTAGAAIGHEVYAAECITPSVSVGDTVSVNTPIGTMITCNDATFQCSPCGIETGWADPNHLGAAMGKSQWNGANSTAFGVNFNQFLVSLGTPSGIQINPTQGTLPAGWPNCNISCVDSSNEQVTVARVPGGQSEDLLKRDHLAGYEAPTDSAGTILSWNPLGGTLRGSPTAVWNSGSGLNTLDVFAIGTNAHVYHIAYSATTGWGSWTQIPASGNLGIAGNAGTESVNAARRPSDGGIDLFIRGAKGDAQHAYLDSAGNFQYWETLGGFVKGAPSGRWTSTQETLDVFAIGSNNHPYRDEWISGRGWLGWQGPLSGTAASSESEVVMMIRRPDDTGDLFLQGTDGAAYHTQVDLLGSIVQWERLGGVVKGAPDGKWDGAGTRLDIFAVGSNDGLYQNTWSSGKWSGWRNVASGGVWS